MIRLFNLILFAVLLAVGTASGQLTVKDRLVIDSYLEAFGFAPSDAELKYWMGRSDWTSKPALVELHRQYLRTSADIQKQAVDFAHIRAFSRKANAAEFTQWIPVAKQGTTCAEIEKRLRNEAAQRNTQEKSRDPWIGQAFQEVVGRAPRGSGTDGEWNPKNYGSGTWSSYNDLVNKIRVKMTGQGVAYTFIKPEQAVYQGHIGWGFIMDDGRYRYGSTENPMKPVAGVVRTTKAVWDALTIDAGQDNGYWHGTADTEQEMLADMKRAEISLSKTTRYPHGFRCSGYWHYKSTTVLNRNSNSAVAAGTHCKNTGFKGWMWNCLDQTYSILEAYGVDKTTVMPWKQDHPSPNHWFNDFGHIEPKTLKPVKGNNNSGLAL